MKELLALLAQYESEWTNKCPDPIMKRNLRERIFAVSDKLRVPAAQPAQKQGEPK